MFKKTYCLKCSNLSTKDYEVDLCEKHYNNQFDSELAKELAMSDIGLTEDEAELAVQDFENLL